MRIRYRTKDYLNCTAHTIFGISIRTWLQVIAKNNFAIDLCMLPKALFLTINSLLQFPLQLVEHIRFHRKIKNVTIKNPVFILGYWRSGTTHLHNILSKDPTFTYCATYEALAPNVFLSAGGAIKKMLQRFMPATRPQDNVKTGADMPVEEEFAMGNISTESFVHGYYFPKHLMQILNETVLFTKRKSKHLSKWQKQFDFFLKKLSYKHPGKMLLLKSPANTARIKEILQLYPDAQFIHIRRNPYSVYQSNTNLYEKILPLLSFHKPKNEAVENFIFDSYELMHKKFLNDRKLLSKQQLYEMSYEDFIQHPIKLLQQAYLQLKLGDASVVIPHWMQEIKRTDDYKTNTYQHPDSETMKRIEKQWKFMFDEYGYQTITKYV